MEYTDRPMSGEPLPEVDVRHYATVLRQAIHAAGLSVTEVERRLGVGPKSLRRVFGGQVDLKLQHVVVVNGGAWHTDDNTGLYIWDTVLYQDPSASRPSLTLDAGTWMELNSAMVIGAAASGGSVAFLNEYGPNVAVRGSNFRYLLPKNN
jgi:hypothetical protein